jgi:MFS family permease
MTQTTAGPGYRAVLSLPGALRFCVAGAVGRMPMAMYGLGSLLLIAALTGRYGLAGAASAAGSAGYAACSPLLGRLADRYGQRRVLRPATAVFTAATAGFVACAELRAPDPAVLAAALAAGGSMPSLGPMVRARWSALLGGAPGLGTAYALESVVDEACFVVGPAVATVLATEVQPAAAVITAAALCALGTLALAGQAGTEPAPAPPAARAARPARVRGRGRGGRLPAPGLVTLAPVTALLCAMFAAIDVSTVAFAQQLGHKPLAGLILGTYALGSAAGGLWYGARSWRAPLERRFAVTLCLAAAGPATFWAAPGLIALDLLALAAGLAIAPTLIAAFSLVERQAPAARRTEAISWISAAAGVGVAAGSALAGQVADAGGGRWGYVLAAGCGGLAAAAGLGGLGRLGAGAPPPDGDISQDGPSVGPSIMTEAAPEG